MSRIRKRNLLTAIPPATARMSSEDDQPDGDKPAPRSMS